MRRESLISGRAVRIPEDAILWRRALFRCEASCILLVEKEAVLQRLLDDGFLIQHPDVLLASGAGFPDLATRAFVAKLALRFQLGCFGLFDWNPHGVLIMDSFSRALASTGAACSSVTWIGLLSEQIDGTTGSKPLTSARDMSLLARLVQQSIDEAAASWPVLPIEHEAVRSHQLREMLRRQVKFDIESLYPLLSSSRDDPANFVGFVASALHRAKLALK